MIGPTLASVADAVAEAARLAGVTFLSAVLDESTPVSDALRNRVPAIATHGSAASAIAGALGAATADQRSLVICARPDPAALAEAARLRIPLMIVAIGHPDALGPCRDTGALITICDTLQELLDTVVLQYKINEDGKVLLPTVVLWNGPVSYAEPLTVPSDQMIKNLLPPLKLPHRLDPKRPSMLIAAEPAAALIRQQQYKAFEQATKAMIVLDDQWKKKIKRSLSATESFHLEDADRVLVTYGYHTPTAKAVVEALRAKGVRAGLLRIRQFRPFPAVASLLAGKKIAVLEHSAAPGSSAPLCQEIRAQVPCKISVLSLNTYLSEQDVAQIFTRLEKAEKEELQWIDTA